MNTKEKAFELVDEFKEYADEEYHECSLQYDLNKARGKNAKQCALIAVNEILKSRPCLPICISTDGGSSEALIDANNFWNEVKKEIENL